MIGVGNSADDVTECTKMSDVGNMIKDDSTLNIFYQKTNTAANIYAVRANHVESYSNAVGSATFVGVAESYQGYYSVEGDY